MIADHLAFHRQLCFPEDTGVSMAHISQRSNLFSGCRFPSVDPIMPLTQVAIPLGERIW